MNIIRALRSRNLRLYFIGQGISLVGTWITTVASSWLVYRLTDSKLLLGVVAFSSQFPTAILSPLAGAIVDRRDKRLVLLGTQALSMVQSMTLFALAYSGQITIMHIVVLNVVQAVVNAFDLPGRQSFLIEIVEDKQDLPNSIALNAALFHGSRLIGPAIAGILVALVGEAPCFLIDGFSYAGVLGSLMLIHGHAQSERENQGSVLSALRDGWRYVRNHREIADILCFVSLLALVGTPQMTLMPVFAKEILHGGADSYGYLMAASGAGAFFGAMYLASRPRGASLRVVVTSMPFVLAIALVLFALSRSMWSTMSTSFASGFALVTVMAGCNSTLQMLVEDRKRARVMSLYGASFFGMAPLGGLLTGACADVVGAPATVLVCGLLVLIVAAVYLLRILKTAPSSAA